MMAQAKAQGVRVVPTMIQRGNFAAISAGGQGRFPVWQAHLRRLYQSRYAQAQALHEAGVPLLVGTDVSANIRHGRFNDETDLLARAGLPAPAIVAAASWEARRYLGRPGIEPGASADVVVYPADPRQSVAVLRSPRAVILRGRLVAGALAS
jgi:imidazolonepropionase-like amidohydrolase